MKKMTVVVAVAMFILTSLSAGAGEWKAVYTRVVFWDDATGIGRAAIFTSDSQGNEVKLTHNDDVGTSTHASWSPDGQEIVYVARLDDGDAQLHVMNSDGTDQRSIGVPAAVPSVGNFHIVFGRGADLGRSEVWVVRRESDAVAHSLALGWNPSISADGKQVTFEYGDIYVVNIDGTNKHWVAEGRYPKFLPDGRIVVAREMAQDELWIVDPETGEEEFLTMGFVSSTSVSNDGWVIYFKVRGRRGWYAIHPDTGEEVLLYLEENREQKVGVGKNAVKIFGDLSPPASEEPREVKARGKLPSIWGKLKQY